MSESSPDPAVAAIIRLHESKTPGTPIRAVVQRAVAMGYSVVPPATGSAATYLRLIHRGAGRRGPVTLYVDGVKLSSNGKALRGFAASLAGARQTPHDVQFRFDATDPSAVLEAFRGHVTGHAPGPTLRPSAGSSSDASPRPRVHPRPAPAVPYPVSSGARRSRSASGGHRTATRVGVLGLAVIAAIVVAALVGGRGGGDSTTASDLHPAAVATSTFATPATASIVATTSQAPALPPPPVLVMTCPPPGTTGSATFAHQIIAAEPYTVAIDYGDGDRYSNDAQHLDAVFTHTYQAAGSFTVTAVLTDVAGQTTSAACAYSWTPPAPPPPPPATTGDGSGGTTTGAGGSSSGGPSSGGSSSGGSSSGGSSSGGSGGSVNPPAGLPTALCRDGTYSYSQHRSGTCSHHGGVAQWLSG